MIKVFNPKKQYQKLKKPILRRLKKVLEKGDYILGEEVKELEDNFKRYFKTKYAIAVKNGTDALLLSLKSLNIGRGDEVITTSHTALATIAAIIESGATPVIVDIEREYFTIDPSKILSSITNKTKAIIPVHIYGQAADMKKILDISKKKKIYIIEDCSQSIGAMLNNKKIGTFGDISTFSFYPTKNLGALGDGGLIITNNSKIGNILVRLRQYGWDKFRNTLYPGINSRLDELQASILNIKFKNIDKNNQKRINLANNYLHKLKNNSLKLPKKRINSEHVYHIFSVSIKNRKKFINYLNKNNIYPGIHYLKPVSNNLGYKKYCKLNKFGIKNAVKLSKENVSLPIYPELTFFEQNKIIKLINKFNDRKN